MSDANQSIVQLWDHWYNCKVVDNQQVKAMEVLEMVDNKPGEVSSRENRFTDSLSKIWEISLAEDQDLFHEVPRRRTDTLDQTLSVEALLTFQTR